MSSYWPWVVVGWSRVSVSVLVGLEVEDVDKVFVVIAGQGDAISAGRYGDGEPVVGAVDNRFARFIYQAEIVTAVNKENSFAVGIDGEGTTGIGVNLAVGELLEILKFGSGCSKANGRGSWGYC